MAKTPDVIFEEEIKDAVSSALHRAGWDNFALPIVRSAYKYAAQKANELDGKGVHVSALSGEFTVSVYVYDGVDDDILETEDVSLFKLLTDYSAYPADIALYERLISDLQTHVNSIKQNER